MSTKIYTLVIKYDDDRDKIESIEEDIEVERRYWDVDGIELSDYWDKETIKELQDSTIVACA